MSFDLSAWATNLGWTRAAAVSPVLSPDRLQYFETWLQSLPEGQMKYLERRKDERLHPEKFLPGVKSVFVFGLYYFPGWAKGEVKVSNYSWGKDYHNVLKEKLLVTVQELQKEFGSFEYRLGVDTSPILEKLYAAESGLGWQGKNTLFLTPKEGSYLFLGEIFTTLDLEKFETKPEMKDHCGTCTRCIEACPTDALSPYELTADRCISYWTLEHKGPFTEKTPKWKEWVAGCDICQEVCPWNQKLISLTEGFDASLSNLTRAEIKKDDWPERIKNSALNYVPKENWKRNLEHVDR